MTEPECEWTGNYFNYFTEIEEHFQRVRGTSLFLLSPLDWALIETWKNSEVPLQAVLRGIELAFEKWRSRKSKIRMINSLAYCAQAVLEEAQRIAGVAQPASGRPVAAPFELEELRQYLETNARLLRDVGLEDVAGSLDRLTQDVEQHYQDLEQLEQRLGALEEKMIATLRVQQTEDQLFDARRALDVELRPYRSRMTAEQLTMLEKQYFERRLLEQANLPRLSLFYLR